MSLASNTPSYVSEKTTRSVVLCLESNYTLRGKVAYLRVFRDNL